MRRNNEIEYIKAEEYLKGRFEAELTNLAFARGLVPEKLASRIFVGNNPRNTELLPDASPVQVFVPGRQGVRVQTSRVGKRRKQVEDSGSAHGKAHPRKLSAIKAYWMNMSPEQRKAEMARRLKKRRD